jgi:signal transduction histidine kinase
VKARTRSIALRQGVLTGIWVMLGLALMWVWVAQIVASATESSFDARILSLLDSLTAATGIEKDQPYLLRPVSEPLLDRPFSGVYFQIEGPGGSLITSRSLGDTRLPAGVFGHGGVRFTEIDGPRGQRLRMLERDLVPPDTSLTVHVLVAEDAGAMRMLVTQTNRKLGAGFLTLGVGLVLAVVLQAFLGLGSLRRLHDAVADLRAGREIGSLQVASEVQPLVDEIEALVGQNRATVARARNHIGNLAHSLRTRLSVMRNALGTGDLAMIEQELLEAERLVSHHLARARAASLAGAAATDVSVHALAGEIASALRLLFRERGVIIDIEIDESVWVRCEREDFLEMLGNLMENACKWCRHRLAVSAVREGSDILITVSDDGPGLPEECGAIFPDRGRRLDERTPGSGLGLSIVTDLASLYGGSLSLSVPRPGCGLVATLALPASRGMRKQFA